MPAWSRASRLLLCIALAGAAASAEPDDTSSEGQSGESRSRMVVVVVGDAETEVFAQLETLVPQQVADDSVHAEFENTTQLSLAELKARTSDRRVRFVTMLDVSDPERWRLILIDPTTGRALARTVPGTQVDKAALEAVIAIISSTNEALASGRSVGDSETAAAFEQTLAEPSGSSAPPPEPDSVRVRLLADAAHAVGYQVSVALGAQPVTVPGGYSVHGSASVVYSAPGLRLFAGPSVLFSPPDRIETALGYSEFDELRIGAHLGAALPIAQDLQATFSIEPYAGHLRVMHHSDVDGVVVIDTPQAWALGARTGIGAWFWLTSNLGLSASSGAAVRARAPVYTDSRGDTLLRVDQISWFLQGGLLLQWN